VILLIADNLFLCQVIIAFTVISLTQVSMNKILGDLNKATSDSVFDVTFCRDFRILSIGGGADEVMLSIIAKEMNILPSKKK